MELEKYAKEWMQGENGEALKKLAESEAGARLAARFDGVQIENAARTGDTKALTDILKGVLSTPEGKAFAQQVQKAVKRDGR